jgi:hypothetical protein
MGVNKKIIESQVASAAAPENTFNVVLYTGNGTSNQDITGVGFQADLTIIKKRSGSGTVYWGVWDSVRGTGGQLYLSISNAETSTPNRLSSWNSDGFNLGNNVDGEYISTGNWVSYNFKGGGTAVSNTNGDITSSVSANVEAGFSVVAYSGNSTSNQTIGHGLESAPELILLKERNGNEFWLLHHTPLMTQNQFVYWNTTNAIATNSKIFGGSPTATTFTVSGGGYDGTNRLVNTSGRNYIAYCFHSVEGYQKVGTYTGNGTASTSNPIIDIGFRPDFVMLRELDTTGSLTRFFDTARGGTGQNNKQLSNDTSGEYAGLDSTDYIKFEDTGFRVTTSNATYNESGKDYMFLAIKKNNSAVATGEMSFLVVAGGGGGGNYAWGAGGGAGGLRTSYGSTSGGGASAESNITLASGTYTITVGAAGGIASNGVDSSIAASGLTTITSTGGGAGGRFNGLAGASGGSGGGGGGGSSAGSGASGTANQGYAGGNAAGNVSGQCAGGGGGASAVGGTAAANSSGDGGAGLSVAITGTSTAYAGGGGGAVGRGDQTTETGGIGGSSVGGNGGRNTYYGGSNGADPTAGTTNTGSGGGGGKASGNSANAGGGAAGGSGIVILRLRTSEYSGTTTGSPTVTTDGSDTILKFTGSGTYVH